MPPLLQQGLETAVENGGFEKVYLLSYQALARLPHGVELRDASDFLPRRDVDELFTGLSMSFGKSALPICQT